MFFRKEADPLNGVFASAWAIQPSLPSSCEKVSGFRCGTIETKLPRHLRRFLDIGKNKRYNVKVGLMVLDGYTESLANLSIEAGASRAVFTITTEKLKSDGGIVGTNRKLSVRKGRGDTLGEPEENAEANPRYVGALNDLLKLLRLNDKEFKEVDKPLLCRTCPAQIDGLPRSVT